MSEYIICNDKVCEGDKAVDDLVELRAMIKRAVGRLVVDPDDLSKIMALGMYVSDRTPVDMLPILKEQLNG